MALKNIIKFFLLFAYVATEDVTIQTDFGSSITGEVVDVEFVDGTPLKVTQFRGIPYAEPPTGARRFQKPVKLQNFPANLIAKDMPAMCLQNSGIMRLFGINPAWLNQKEDCLYLNIYIPGNITEDQTTTYAVMIWFYPGKWEYGFMDTYDAKAFAALNNVILVLFNHRNSMLGFLSTGDENFPGNYGLWDQHLALDWVSKNIHNFRGNPQSITLFGESTGASSAIYQALHEDNEGLFHRIIAQSCSVNSPISYFKDPRAPLEQFANRSNCSSESDTEMIECLRSLSFQALIDLIQFEDEFGPVTDGDFIKYLPDEIFFNKTDEAWEMIQRLGKLDLIIGFNSAEGGLDIPKTQRWIDSQIPSVSNYYTKPIFEDIIVPFALERVQMQFSGVLQEAIIHQYSDWSDPENSETIFARTINLFSDIVFNAAITKTATSHSDSGEDGSLYFYLFDYPSPISDLDFPGAQHFDEVGYTLGFPPWFAARYPARNLNISQTEIDLSKAIMKYWTNFAKTG